METPGIAEVLHFNAQSKILSVEDPQLVYYLRNLDWAKLPSVVGFTKIDFEQEYDIALSFAGEDRLFAENLRDQLEELGHALFYDFAEQHRILTNDVEKYLGPIYSSGSRFVAAVLGEKYGTKQWTLFAADHYRDRIQKGEVIPIWSKRAPVGAFDATRTIGGLQFDPDRDLVDQAFGMAEVISKKLAES